MILGQSKPLDERSRRQLGIYNSHFFCHIGNNIVEVVFSPVINRRVSLYKNNLKITSITLMEFTKFTLVREQETACGFRQNIVVRCNILLSLLRSG